MADGESGLFDVRAIAAERMMFPVRDTNWNSTAICAKIGTYAFV